MSFAVRVEPAAGELPAVDYRWDADTDILTAGLRPVGASEGLTGSVEVVGDDGSWLVLDVAGGRITGIEVAVWPEVRTLSALSAPAGTEAAQVVVPARGGAGGLAAIDVNAPVAAEADPSERTIRFRIGTRRRTRTVRIARGVLLDLDARDHVVGLWLLDVPPSPTEAAGDAARAHGAAQVRETPSARQLSSPDTPE